MIHITSLYNHDIKHLVRLHTTKERKQAKQCIAEGFRTIVTFLEGKTELLKLYITEEHEKEARSITDASDIVIVSEAVMRKISAAATPSGILGHFTIPQPIQALGPGLVLAQVSDPGNMGTLIRTAIACGIHSIVVVEGTDPWSPKVIQASAGTISWAHLFQWDWSTLIQNKKGLQLCALVVHEGKTPDTLDASKALLVIGNEAHGLPPEWQKQCDTLVTLPMPGCTESLNAAIAGALALYWTFVLPPTSVK